MKLHLLLALSVVPLPGQESATPASEFESERLQQLRSIRRIYIDKLTGENSSQIRDMLIAALQSSGLFIVTENPERADATLRGSAEDLLYTDTFQSSEGINARGNVSVSRGGTTRSTSRSSVSLGSGAGESESTRISERRHEATVSLRLVNREGDVLWSTTQESKGAKFRGASADVAEKVMKKLTEEYHRARGSPSDGGLR